ncbi:CLUMA_CG019575, isoform A, partial [Clunio marinus]
MSGSTKWLRPDELIKIQRKCQKLQERAVNNTRAQSQNLPSVPYSNRFANGKRNNPFAKNSDQDSKKLKQNEDRKLTIDSDDTLFELLHTIETTRSANLVAPSHELPNRIVNKSEIAVIDDEDEDDEKEAEGPKYFKNLPIDWSIKNRVRILSKTIIVNNNLTSSEQVSGMTGFVRCIDMKSTSSSINISDGAKFNQNLMFWQYPHLPWLNLVQRNASSNNAFKMNTPESESLLVQWKESFRNLSQLLRALQCPYFYVLTNQFMVLFRAAGIGGRAEMHALVTPTTRGFRKLLKEEEIEFTQPLKKIYREGSTPNTSIDNENLNPGVEDEEEEDEMKFLEDLGVDTSDIKFKEDVKTRNKETEDDNGELSTIVIEGVECQAFFAFLLTTKTLITNVGRLAGVPPTLIAPVAFLGSSLQKQTTRASKLRSENEDFHSIELRGAILPHT